MFIRLLTPYLSAEGKAIPFDTLRDQYNLVVHEHVSSLMKSGGTASDSALRYKTTAFIKQYATSMSKRIAAQEALKPHGEFLSLQHQLVQPAPNFPPISIVGGASSAAPVGPTMRGASLDVQPVNVGAPVMLTVATMLDETPQASLNRWRTKACNTLGWDADIDAVNNHVVALAVLDKAAGLVGDAAAAKAADAKHGASTRVWRSRNAPGL